MFHPGSYLKDYLEAAKTSIKEFSLKSDISEKVLKDLIKGKIDIDDELAQKISTQTHTSSLVWINLQRTYDKEKN